MIFFLSNVFHYVLGDDSGEITLKSIQTHSTLEQIIVEKQLVEYLSSVQRKAHTKKKKHLQNKQTTKEYKFLVDISLPVNNLPLFFFFSSSMYTNEIALRCVTQWPLKQILILIKRIQEKKNN